MLDVAKVRKDLIYKKSEIESLKKEFRYFKSYLILKYVFMCTYLFIAIFLFGYFYVKTERN